MVNVKRKRIPILTMSAVVMALSGLMYVWTNYSGLIRADFGWDLKSLSLTFTIWNIGVGLGGIAAGFLLRKFSAKKIILVGAVLEVLGFALSALVGENGIILLYISFGVFVGFGSGLTNIPIMNTVLAWYPDKPGFASGVIMFGLGIGTLVLGTASSYIAESFGWKTGFLINAVVVFVVFVAVMLIVKRPGEDDVLPQAVKKPDKEKSGFGQEYKPSQMLKRTSFWLFAVWAVLGQMSNVIVSSQARQSADEIMAVGTVATMAVGIMHLFCSVGSIGFGTVYDRIGRKKTMMIENILLIVGALFFVVAMKYASVWAMVAGLVVLGVTTGGLPSTNAAFILEFYGAENYPANYSIILLRGIPASFGAYFAAAVYDVSGTYLVVYLAMTAMLLVPLIISPFIKRP